MANNRAVKVQQWLKEKELDGVLIYSPANRRYLSGFAGSTGYALITESGQIFSGRFSLLGTGAAAVSRMGDRADFSGDRCFSMDARTSDSKTRGGKENCMASGF